jgi:uncharacterized protein (TIGR03437 family)
MKALLCGAILFASAAAFGQPGGNVPAIQCVANAAVPPTVRSEGITELVGDLTLQCTGGTPTAAGQPVPATSITVVLNTQITNRVYSNGTSDALLLIDEPGSTKNSVPLVGCFTLGGCTIVGTGNGVGTYSGGAPNVFQARQNGPSSVTWEGVPFDPPGTNGLRVIRVTNVRANANQLGVTNQLTPQQILAGITFSGLYEVINGELHEVAVANAQPGVLVSVPNPGSFQWCSGFNGNGIFSEPTQGIASPATFGLQFLENFPGALKSAAALRATPDLPDSLYTESGLTPPGPGFPSDTGLANFGTRLRVNFSNIPAGVNLQLVSVGNLQDSKGKTAGTYITASPTGVVSGNNLTISPDSTGSASAYFQVQTRDSTNPNPVSLTPAFTVGGAPTGLRLPLNIEAVLGFPNSQFPQNNLFAPGSSLTNSIPTYGPLDPGVSNPAQIPYLQAATVVACTNGGNSLNSSVTTNPSFINVFGSTAGGNARLGEAQPKATATTGPYLIAPRISNVGIVSAALPTTSVTVAANPPAPWLNVALSGTTTPLTAFLSANNAAVGNHSTILNFSSPGGIALSVPVTYAVTQGPWFTRYGFANSASYVNNVVAPGEPFVLFGGDAFGPATLAPPALGPDGRAVSMLGNTQVLFDGTPAPLYYSVDANGIGQVAGFAPFSLATKTSTNVQVVYNGVTSPPVQLFVLDAVPGLYTANSSGGGQGSILNQDLSINGAANPESPGNVIVLYGGGAGQTTPGGRDGALSGIGGPLAKLTLPVKVFIDGIAATDIPYAGPAPGLVEGVFQINVRIPPGVRHNANVLVVVQVEDKQTQPGVTLATK